MPPKEDGGIADCVRILKQDGQTTASDGLVVIGGTDGRETYPADAKYLVKCRLEEESMDQAILQEGRVEVDSRDIATGDPANAA